jgi:hypothetical protein|tara:strand:- start:3613 stop:4602 length:990 start_codon:yes stop_codon:yes gene_type:complete
VFCDAAKALGLLSGPVLIVVPKSTVPNWTHELKTWCPTLDCVTYTGGAAAREALRKVDFPGSASSVRYSAYSVPMNKQSDVSGANENKQSERNVKQSNLRTEKPSVPVSVAEPRKKGTPFAPCRKFCDEVAVPKLEAAGVLPDAMKKACEQECNKMTSAQKAEWTRGDRPGAGTRDVPVGNQSARRAQPPAQSSGMGAQSSLNAAKPSPVTTGTVSNSNWRLSGGGSFTDVVLTNYEIAMSDTSVFKSVRWGAIIVDEGHRLKNQNSRLTRTLLSFNCPWRCLLTGTPLQNNLVRIGVFPNPNSIVFPKSRHTVCRLSRVITHTRGPKD